MGHKIVVIGAGYAGLPAARRLARQLRADEVTVTLVNAFDEFVERPRLHQIAVGQDISRVPLSRYLKGSGVDLRIASVTDIDLAGKRIRCVDPRGARQTLAFDTLVYALGSNIDLTSVPGVAEHCATLVGTSCANEVHGRLTDMAAAGGTVTVCGGGMTGIEIVTEIAAAFPTIRTRLISAGTLGSWLSDKGRDYLHEVFGELGVAVIDRSRVDLVEPGHLVLADGRHVPFELCVWAGGFTVPALALAAGLAVNATGRALVDETLRSVTHSDVYVIGDAAAVAGAWGEQLAMGCRSGGFTGPQAADIIVSRLSGRAAEPFRFRYFHECISLGRRRGLVQFLNSDGTPKNQILTGRTAITYKNMTLNGARLLFRHTGPMLERRRHLTTTATCAAETSPVVTPIMPIPEERR